MVFAAAFAVADPATSAPPALPPASSSHAAPGKRSHSPLSSSSGSSDTDDKSTTIDGSQPPTKVPRDVTTWDDVQHDANVRRKFRHTAWSHLYQLNYQDTAGLPSVVRNLLLASQPSKDPGKFVRAILRKDDALFEEYAATMSAKDNYRHLCFA